MIPISPLPLLIAAAIAVVPFAWAVVYVFRLRRENDQLRAALVEVAVENFVMRDELHEIAEAGERWDRVSDVICVN